MTMNFKGKTAVIAGDAWGLGHAAALLFAREGAEVICIDDNADQKTRASCDWTGLMCRIFMPM